AGGARVQRVGSSLAVARGAPGFAVIARAVRSHNELPAGSNRAARVDAASAGCGCSDRSGCGCDFVKLRIRVVAIAARLATRIVRQPTPQRAMAETGQPCRARPMIFPCHGPDHPTTQRCEHLTAADARTGPEILPGTPRHEPP